MYNPDDPLLYKELSWIFLHKLGNLMDDANLYYKNQLATQMTNILGSTTPDWEKLASAPANQAEFMKIYPEDSEFWVAVKKAGYNNYDELFTAFMTPVKAALPDTLRLYLNQEQFNILEGFFRAELLRKRLKLDPVKMVAIDRKYGKMDWRVPESQALYWAETGIEKSIANSGKPEINCIRIVSHALQSAFRSGRLLTMDADGKYIQMVPNLNLADSAYKAFEAGEAEFSGSGAGNSFRSAKINYLKDAIPLIYINGNITKAQEFFDKLVAIDGPQKRRTLDEFVMVEYAEDVRDADIKKASGVVSGLIQRAIFNMLIGNREAAVANERLARHIHHSYSLKNKDVKRNTLPPYNEIKKGVVQNNLVNLPPAMRSILEAEIAAEQARDAENAAGKYMQKETTAM